MVLVNIDGVDATGKTTLVENLINHYTKQGLKITYTHFPRYNTPIGKVIEQVLDKKLNIHPSSFQMLCSADRLEWSTNEYLKLKEEYDMVIVDRHTTSALVYGMLDGLDEEEILFNDRRIVKPDINIILFASIDTLIKRLEKRNIATTLYEKQDIMKKALEKYLGLYKFYPSVTYVNAEQSIEKVKDSAVKIINKYLQKGCIDE